MSETDLVTAALASVSVVALVLAWVALRQSARAIEYGRRACQYTQEANEESVSLAKLASLECTMTELTDSYDALLTSHKKLRSRIGMREHRQKGANGSADLDSRDKVALRLSAKSRGLLR